MHCHGNCGNDEIALVNEADKLFQGEMAEVGCPAFFRDALVPLMLLLTAEEKRNVSATLQLLCERDPILFCPQPRNPSSAATRI